MSRLHVDSDGRGVPFVLAHGFGGSARNFGGQARALATRCRVLRYDARGHARSPAPEDVSAYTPETFVADLASVLAEAGAERAIVGGLSMGGGTAVRFALAYPERVIGLVVCAFPPGADVPGGFAAVARSFAAAIERRGLDAAGAEFVWGAASGLDPHAARLVRQGFLEHTAHGLAHTLRGVIAHQPAVRDLAPALRGLRCPALVIVGADDAPSLGPSRELAHTLPHARLVVVEGAGHLVNLARPAAVNAALTGFVDALLPASNP